MNVPWKKTCLVLKVPSTAATNATSAQSAQNTDMHDNPNQYYRCFKMSRCCRIFFCTGIISPDVQVVEGPNRTYSKRNKTKSKSNFKFQWQHYYIIKYNVNTHKELSEKRKSEAATQSACCDCCRMYEETNDFSLKKNPATTTTVGHKPAGSEMHAEGHVYLL